MNKIAKSFEILNSVITALIQLSKHGYLIITANILQSSYKLSNKETKDIIDYLYHDKDYIRPIYRCYNPNNNKEYVDFKKYSAIPFGKKVHDSHNKLTSFAMSKNYIKYYYFITPKFMAQHKETITA